MWNAYSAIMKCRPCFVCGVSARFWWRFGGGKPPRTLCSCAAPGYAGRRTRKSKRSNCRSANIRLCIVSPKEGSRGSSGVSDVRSEKPAIRFGSSGALIPNLPKYALAARERRDAGSRACCDIMGRSRCAGSGPGRAYQSRCFRRTSTAASLLVRHMVPPLSQGHHGANRAGWIRDR